MNTNPWLGFASYDEVALKLKYKFVGRNKEIGELFSLIDDNLLVTLYGKSGIGKSSLLNAGVFPALRAADYLPIVCRCDEGIYPESIIQQMVSECEIHYTQEKSQYNNLVEFFRNCEFSKDGTPVFPVLVFDQFEDWFRLNQTATVKLLKDISFLISSNYEGYTNYRFVISIREDYLYMLEDAIDSIDISELKHNRYRLTELKKEQAEEIMDLGYISDNVRERILEISKENMGYNPGLLSLFCSELFLLFPFKIEDEALVYLDNTTALIESYYNRCLNNPNISFTTKNYIETHLQEDGLRHPQNIENVKRSIPAKELNFLLNGSNKLLRKFPIGNEEHIELLHDSVAKVIYEKITKDNYIKRDKYITIALTSYFIPIIILVWQMLLKLLRVCWAVNLHNNLKKYINDIRANNDHGWLYDGISSEIAYFTAYSQLLSSIVVIIMLIFTLPKDICTFFYNKLSPKKFGVNLALIIILWLLSSDMVLVFNSSLNSVIYIIMEWVLILSVYFVGTKFIKYHEKR